MKVVSLLLAIALWTPSLAASAHEGGHDERGIITSVSADELTIRNQEGEKKKFTLRKETEYLKDGAPATAQDLSVGSRAVVHAKDNNGRMEAFKVQFASAPAPKKK
jgi:hypothetical protein